MSLEAQERLRALLRERDGFRRDLRMAEVEGLDAVALAAQREIRRLHRRIQKHCDFLGLPLPADVLEWN